MYPALPRMAKKLDRWLQQWQLKPIDLEITELLQYQTILWEENMINCGLKGHHSLGNFHVVRRGAKQTCSVKCRWLKCSFGLWVCQCGHPGNSIFFFFSARRSQAISVFEICKDYNAFRRNHFIWLPQLVHLKGAFLSKCLGRR